MTAIATESLTTKERWMSAVNSIQDMGIRLIGVTTYCALGPAIALDYSDKGNFTGVLLGTEETVDIVSVYIECYALDTDLVSEVFKEAGFETKVSHKDDLVIVLI